MNKGLVIIIIITIFCITASASFSFATELVVDGVEVASYPCAPITLKNGGGGFDAQIVGWEDMSPPISFWNLTNGDWLFVFPPIFLLLCFIVAFHDWVSSAFAPRRYRRPPCNYGPREFY